MTCGARPFWRHCLCRAFPSASAAYRRLWDRAVMTSLFPPSSLPVLSACSAFLSRWGTVLAATILIGVFCALWSVLLIVPGILAALSYSMTFYIMMDDESISPMDAIRKSKKMMYGHRWRFVCFCFRYAGWLLLALLPYIAVYMVWGDSRPILSSAIMYAGLIPLSVYFGVGVAAFYEDLKTSQAPEVPTP